jgi:tetratricopeptide (TPR) repeat protein
MHEYPDNAQIMGSYATFLYRFRKNYDKSEKYFEKSLQINPNNGDTLGNYANFLKEIRKEYDKAEEYYKRRLVINPDEVVFGNYATLLSIRGEYDKAEEYYKRCLELNPNTSFNLGNYGGFLLFKGDKHGFDLLRKAEELAEKENNYALLLEVLFYKFSHVQDDESRQESLKKLRSLIMEGIRSPGWDFSNNIKKAIEEGHPCLEFYLNYLK